MRIKVCPKLRLLESSLLSLPTLHSSLCRWHTSAQLFHPSRGAPGLDPHRRCDRQGYPSCPHTPPARRGLNNATGPGSDDGPR